MSRRFQKVAETSPHAWSKPPSAAVIHSGRRNISTCVEQTSGGLGVLPVGGKHLHMRGANVVPKDSRAAVVETSPHAWSKLISYQYDISKSRNISTCVEQTQYYIISVIAYRKHLHMRGANR